MQLITELLNSPEALFAGKILLAFSMFLCSYAIISKVTSTIFKSSRIVGQGLAIVISLYAFQVPFPSSEGPILIPLMWQVPVFSHAWQPSQGLIFLPLMVNSSISAPLSSAPDRASLTNISVFPPFLELHTIPSTFICFPQCQFLLAYIKLARADATILKNPYNIICI
jgi:hypothetical protein